MFVKAACKSALLLTVVCVICLSGYTEDESTRFVIRGPQRVTDGWVSLDKASFAGPELIASGTAWSNYYRVLMKFDLSEINAARYGRVERAILRLEATQVANEEQHETTVAAVAVPWTTDATWSTRDGNNAWPQQKQDSNIDYAMVMADSLSRVITEPGVIQFDVTNIVDAWLYQGAQNNGFLIRTGETIFGKPGAGTWQLTFASSETEAGSGPALIVEMTGNPPAPQDAQDRAMAIYPSPLLPPVREPYIIEWYNTFTPEIWMQMKASNVHSNSAMREWESSHGILPLAWSFGPQSKWHNSQQAWIDYFLPKAANTLGYSVDEWQSRERYPEKVDWSLAALRQAEAAHPESYQLVFWRGEPSLLELADEGLPDLIVIEGYTNVVSQFPFNWGIGLDGIKRRIDTARHGGAIERTIVMLGMIAPPEGYHEGHVLTTEMIDSQIAELRAYAPEMPGIGFYYSGGEQMAMECDALAHKYFVAPAPDVYISEPVMAAKLNTDHVRIRAEATAQGDRTIRQYRWFIDNRLATETEQPSYVWDLRGETNGYHFITVHAVDSAYNRAAAQIMVTVAR